MGTMCVPSKTLCPFRKGCKWAYLVFHRERLEPRVLSWKQNGSCHSVLVVMYISGAKFGEDRSNISGDINDSLFVSAIQIQIHSFIHYFSSETIYDVITSLICIIQKRKYL